MDTTTARYAAQLGCAPGQLRSAAKPVTPSLSTWRRLAGRVRATGVKCRVAEDGLWAGKLCLCACGEVSLNGRVRGLDLAHLGRGVESFVTALRQVRLIPEAPKQPASGTRDRKRGCSWRRLPRAAPRRLKGRRAERAIDRMHAFLAEHDLSCEQLGPGRY